MSFFDKVYKTKNEKDSITGEKLKKAWRWEKNNVKLQKDKYVNLYEFKSKLDPIENEETLKVVNKEVKRVEGLIDKVNNNLIYSAELIDTSGTKFTITSKQADKLKLQSIIGYNQKTVPDFYDNDNEFIYYGNVLFEKEKLYVNIWNFPNNINNFKDDKKALYYKLSDGQTASLKFWEYTATGLTIPFKYRPKDGDNPAIENVFSTSFNAGLFFGASFGFTRFNHRKKIGNLSNTHKFSLGVFINAASEELTENNTSGATELVGGKSQTVGLFSRGLGLVYSRNKLSLGVFMGWDKGVGTLSKKWDYDGLLWLGAGIGYDIFKL